MKYLLSCESRDELQKAHRNWVESKIHSEPVVRESKWTESIAAGSKTFVEKVKNELGFRAKGRRVIGIDGVFELRENQDRYGVARDPGADVRVLQNTELNP